MNSMNPDFITLEEFVIFLFRAFGYGRLNACVQHYIREAVIEKLKRDGYTIKV